MNSNQNKSSAKDSFVVQATILAAAGMISRVIGLLYRSPLQRIIGSAGLGYYQSAYNFYTIVLLVSSYSIPSAISKVIAQKLAVKEYRNAHRIFLCALGYVLVVGTVASLFLFFGAGLFVEAEAIPVLRTFAPTIFVYGILGVLRGYFQAHKSMVQTSVSQILEQIVNALVSVGAAYLLIRSVFPTMERPTESAGEAQWGLHGAIGSAMGTGAGVFVALLFMFGMYMLNKELIHKRIARDRHEEIDSYGSIIRTITSVVTPFILSTAIYNLSSTVNNSLYTKWLPSIREVDTVENYARYGVFSGQALTISNIPIAFASAMAAAMIPTVAQLVAARKINDAKEQIGTAIKITMMISIPCAVGLFVLSRPITTLLFSNTKELEDLSTHLLCVLAVSVILYALSTLNNQILQGLGKLNAPIINAAISLGVQTVVAVLLLRYTSLDLYAVAIANIVYSGLMCILNQLSVRRAIGYRQEIKTTFLIPLLAAVIMGVVCFLIVELCSLLGVSTKIALIPAIAIGVIVYFFFLILFRGVTESELRKIPKGYMIVKAAKKIHLM